MLNVAYDGAPDGATVVDVRDVAEFHTVRSDRTGTSIGAFIAADALAQDTSLANALGAAPLGPHEAIFRLNALGARVLIAGPGATRTADLGAFATAPLPAHEIPVSITLGATTQSVWFGDRRLKRRDGAASFELHVHVALALTGHRVVRATVAYSLDGGSPVLMPAISTELGGSVIGKSTFANAARRGADAFRGDDERTNVLRRTIIPLLLSAFNDAYTASRGSCRSLSQPPS